MNITQKCIEYISQFGSLRFHLNEAALAMGTLTQQELINACRVLRGYELKTISQDYMNNHINSLIETTQKREKSFV
ncbi:hypothetical protein [Vibrio sp. ER1A]|uniref:hypothetical protein n=1 Tax=Vibrio sp. ER1A TaxID=1517681 RepID=UPI0004DD5D7D|nr:hypothetical protein [Vibrio sp. ER1A]KFA99271.1 hypothetical protein HW45_04830 [Vibrio sp. ER1A]